MESIENFKLVFEYESNLPFDLDMDNTFYGSDQTPSPDTFNTAIASGILSASPMHSYDYVSGFKKSNDKLKFNDNVLDYGNMSLDMELRLPTPTGDKIRLETNTFIRVKVYASCEATISP